jgi:uncharacterized protein (TIGR03435 family)
MFQRLTSAGAGLLIVASVMVAQSLVSRPKFDEFEVASIKPPPPGAGAWWIGIQSTHEFAAKNHARKTLIAAAYNLNPRAISGGPEWVDSDRYDIVAKAPNEFRPNLDEQMSMLREHLTDRFQLSFHREQKELRVYTLTVAKGGPRLKESTISPHASLEGPPPLIFVVSPQLVRLPGRNATMADSPRQCGGPRSVPGPGQDRAFREPAPPIYDCAQTENARC